MSAKRLKCYTCAKRVDPQSADAALCASALCRGLLCKACYDASPLHSCSPDCYSDVSWVGQTLYGDHVRRVLQTRLSEYAAARTVTGTIAIGFK